MKHLTIIALLFAFASCKKADSNKVAQPVNNKLIGTYTCTYYGGGGANGMHNGGGRLAITYSNGEYYMKAISGMNYWILIDSAKIEFNGNSFSIPTFTEDSVSAFDPTISETFNGSGQIADSLLTMHYTVLENLPATGDHQLYTYDVNGTK